MLSGLKRRSVEEVKRQHYSFVKRKSQKSKGQRWNALPAQRVALAKAVLKNASAARTVANPNPKAFGFKALGIGRKRRTLNAERRTSNAERGNVRRPDGRRNGGFREIVLRRLLFIVPLLLCAHQEDNRTKRTEDGGQRTVKRTPNTEYSLPSAAAGTLNAERGPGLFSFLDRVFLSSLTSNFKPAS
jgi:hypothetical protein